MNGPEFLLLYGSLLLLGTLGMLLWRAAARRSGLALEVAELRPRDVAYLAGGARRSEATAVLEGPGAPAPALPLPPAVTIPGTTWEAAARARLISADAGPPDAAVDRLEALGLVVPRRRLVTQRWWGSLVCFGLALFGGARVVHGVGAGRPVLYLLGLLAVTGGLWWWATRPRVLSTVRGEAHLRELRATHPLGAVEPVMGFALYGWAALAGFPMLESLLISAGYTQQTTAAGAGGCSATGCSTGCSGGGDGGGGDSGGGDGGGDGGGGCGGCGGD